MAFGTSTSGARRRTHAKRRIADARRPRPRPRRESLPAVRGAAQSASHPPSVDRRLGEFGAAASNHQPSVRSDRDRLDALDARRLDREHRLGQHAARWPLGHRPLHRGAHAVGRPRGLGREPSCGREPGAHQRLHHRAAFGPVGALCDRAHDRLPAVAPLAPTRHDRGKLACDALHLGALVGRKPGPPLEPRDSPDQRGIGRRIRRRKRHRAGDFGDEVGRHGGAVLVLRRASPLADEDFAHQQSARALKVRDRAIHDGSATARCQRGPHRCAARWDILDQRGQRLRFGQTKVHADHRRNEVAIVPRRRPERAHRLLGQQPDDAVGFGAPQRVRPGARVRSRRGEPARKDRPEKTSFHLSRPSARDRAAANIPAPWARPTGFEVLSHGLFRSARARIRAAHRSARAPSPAARRAQTAWG